MTTVDAIAGHPRMQVKLLAASDRATDSLPDTVQMAIAGEAQFFVSNPQQVAAVEGLAEPLIPAPLLIVAGGGHVGQALAEQSRLVGFDIVVVEDRPQFADAALYPADVETRCGTLASLQDELPITSDTYIAIVGRGHLADSENLAACIASRPRTSACSGAGARSLFCDSISSKRARRRPSSSTESTLRSGWKSVPRPSRNCRQHRGPACRGATAGPDPT